MAKLALSFSIVAFAVAFWALAKTPGPLFQLTSGMAAYDLSTPEAAWQSGLAMENARDLQAMMELTVSAREEQRATAKLEESVAFGDRYILFISHREDGKLKHVTRGMKKVQGQDIWVPDYVSAYRVRSKDKALAKRMEDWEKRSE